MAERVEQRVEEWAVDLQTLERVGVLRPNEVKQTAANRKEFNYRIQTGGSKVKVPFIRWIQFEIDLLKCIKLRGNQCPYTERAEVEYRQSMRVAQIYQQAVFQHTNDVTLWLTCLKFCTEAKLDQMAGRLLVRLLRVHFDKPHLWLYAAKWEIENNNNVEGARSLLLRAISRYHPTSLPLYSELFRILFRYPVVESGQQETLGINPSPDIGQGLKTGRLVEVLFESGCKHMPYLDFKLNTIKVCKEFPESHKFQCIVYKSILANHANEELAWDAIAKRELDGFRYVDPDHVDDEPMEVVDLEQEVEMGTRRKRIERSIDVYKEAVKKLNTKEMWSLYIEHALALNRPGPVDKISRFRKNLLSAAMEDGMTEQKLSSKHYLMYIEVLEQNGKMRQIAELLRCGTEQEPQNYEMWEKRLLFHVRRDHEKHASAVLYEAQTALQNPTAASRVPLWNIMLHYLQTKSMEKVDALYKKMLAVGGEVSQILRPKYLEWIVLMKGIAEGRKAFESQEFQNPPCLEVILTMAAMEAIQPDTSLKAIRRCHELATRTFGKSNIEVWIGYVKFELKWGDPQRVSMIYQRAQTVLEDDKINILGSELSFFEHNLLVNRSKK